MGSVLQRPSRQGSDGAHSSSHTLAPHSASPHSIYQSSPSRQQENQSTSRVENTAGYMQQGNHGFAFTAEQSSALSLPHSIKQEGLSLNPEQRARMEHHKAMALARRKEKLEQQNQEEELLLNRLTPVQSTLSSQQYNPVQSTLSSQQDNHLDVYCGSTLGLTDRHSLPSHQDIYGVSTLASTHSAQYLQQGSPSHQDVYGSSTLTSTHSAQSSQQDKHTTLVSVHSSLPLQQNNQGGLASTSVQNPLSLQQGNHGSLALDSVHSRLSSQRIDHSGSAVNSPHGSLTLRHGGYVNSLTLEQRARMACKREEALAKLKEQQKRDHYRSETGTSQCTIADGSANFLSQRSYQHGGSSHVPVELSFPTQKQEDGGFSLTPAQIARIAQQKEAAIARRKKRLQQDAQPMTTQCSGETIVKSSFQEHLATSWFTNNFVKPSQSSSQNETRNFSTTFSQHPQDSYRGPSSNHVQDLHHSGSSLTSVQSLASSQQDTYSGSSLTQEQRARMAHQKEMAIVRRNARLQHQQQDEHHHTHLTSLQCLASSQQDTYSGSSVTQEQRARMAHQKEMAIARRNARLRQQEQDAQQNVYHKPPNSKQETAPVCMESQAFATSLLTNCVVDCSQSASNQESDISLSPHERISSQQDGHDGSSFPTVQSYCSSQLNSDGGFSFTPVESSLSSQEDSYGASFLALANSQQDCASSLSIDHVANCSQSLAPSQCGASILSEQQQVSLREGNMGSISLTPEQTARMASQKERACAKRKMILEQRQLQQHHVNQPSERQERCSQAASPCSPVPRAGACEYFSAEYCDGLASYCCQIASQESQHIQK